jgi:hypothetical protein
MTEPLRKLSFRWIQTQNGRKKDRFPFKKWSGAFSCTMFLFGMMDRLGIHCPYYRRVHRPPFLGDIADKHQLRDEQSVSNRFRKIMDGIRAELERQGLIGQNPLSFQAGDIERLVKAYVTKDLRPQQ